LDLLLGCYRAKAVYMFCASFHKDWFYP